MRKIALTGGVVILAVVIGAMYTALQYGDVSPLYAQGQVIIEPELISAATDKSTLFIIVYDEQATMPMPFGAMRETIHADTNLEAGIGFYLTPERLQIMNPSAPQPQSLRIRARLDSDGQGGPDQPGDLVGEVTGVAFGSKDVTIRINKQVE